MDIMRGTQKPFRFQLHAHGSQTALTPAELEDVEITVGNSLRKTYLEGGVTWDDATPGSERWQFVLTQRESYSLRPGNYPLRVRVKYDVDADWIDGKEFATITIKQSGTEESL